MNTEIIKVLENLHKAIWEENRAPFGEHKRKAKLARENAEVQFRRILGVVNPRDFTFYITRS